MPAVVNCDAPWSTGTCIVSSEHQQKQPAAAHLGILVHFSNITVSQESRKSKQYS